MRRYLPTDALVYKNIQTDSDRKIVFLSGLGLEIRKQREAFVRRYALNQGVSYLALDYTRYAEKNLEVPDYNLGQTFAETIKILEQDKKKLLLCGVCYGGLMALKIASEMPNQVQSVIALSPPHETSEFAWIDKTDLFFKRRVDVLKRKEVSPEILSKMILFQHIIMTAFRGQGRTKIAPNFHGPVHIFHGEKDKLIPAENSIYVQKVLKNPNSVVHITPGAGHALNNDFEMKMPIQVLDQCLNR